MLAKVASTAESPRYELLEAPHSLSQQAERSRAPIGEGAHNDGCGVAWLSGEELRSVRRGPGAAWDLSLRQRVGMLETPALIAHNRRASPGLAIDVSLAHPYTIGFRGEEVAFCHNGRVDSLMTEARERKITDTMVFLERLVSRVGHLDLRDIQEFLAETSEGCPEASLNGLLLSKTGVFAWRWHGDTDQYKFDSDRYFGLHLRETADRVCLASEPLDDARGWVVIPNRTLIHIRNSHSLVETVELRVK
jgi:predicted glutamine amidotransferase